MDLENLERQLTEKEIRKRERIGRLLKDFSDGRIVTDFRFDQVYPTAIRKLSEIHWTPVSVAIQASFIQGNMVDLDWSLFNAFYLFNPFYEHKMPAIRIDETLTASDESFDIYVETVQSKLRLAREGTRVVTYHGFGGEFPPDFELISKIPAGTGYLELWVKQNNAFGPDEKP